MRRFLILFCTFLLLTNAALMTAFYQVEKDIRDAHAMRKVSVQTIERLTRENVGLKRQLGMIK